LTRVFYFGDSELSDGDVIRVSYLVWTNDIVEISEISGRHAGWAYREGEPGAGPWLLGALGVFLFFSGILGWITDGVARPDATEA
jgi:hypothetical protein